MSDTKFGPWQADRVTYPLDGFYETQVVHRGSVVAVARSREKEKSGKIARLIAAAPELQTELKACIQNLTMAMLVMDAEARAVCMECIQAHKAVLAKAEATQ